LLFFINAGTLNRIKSNIRLKHWNFGCEVLIFAMANRSHLYVLSADPAITAESELTINGLSEFNYNIPRAHFIFATSNPYVRQSFLFDGKLAIVADYAKGKERLMRILELLDATGKMDNPQQFHTAVEETKQFLSLPENQGTHVLLEAGEIFALSANDMPEMEKDCLEWSEAMALFGKRLDELLAFNIKPSDFFAHDWIVNDKQFGLLKHATENWEESWGIDWWSNVLYYSFNNK
jgi:hypothetical protein